MIDLINENELNILFRPNRVAGLIRNIARNIFELLGIEQNIIIEPIRIINPIAHVDALELNVDRLNIEHIVMRDQFINPPAINPALLNMLLKAEPKPKPKAEIEQTVDNIVNQMPKSAFSLAHIRPYQDGTLYATETPGVFSNVSPFN